jgi:hypothetical protein
MFIERKVSYSRSKQKMTSFKGHRNLIYIEAGKHSREKYHCTVDLRFDWFGISCMTTDRFCFYLQNRLIQTVQTGGQLYSDTSPFSVP